MKPARWLLPLLTLTTVGFVVLGVAVGSERLDLLRAFESDSYERTIALDIRLPRVLLALVTGGGLAVVGVAFQAVLKNPLAEPYVLGVSGGAALGATVGIVLGLGGTALLGASTVPLFAFVGGLGATALVYGLAQRGGELSGTSVLLAGVVVNAMASALITFVKSLVSASTAQELLFWLMGFLDVPSMTALGVVAGYVALGTALVYWDSGRLNLLALGEESAEHLGVDVRRLERRVFIACSLVVGAVVSVTGLIGFVGLIVPHALRKLLGPDVRVLVPAAFLGGAATLIGCDLASRLLFRMLHTEPPVGAVTAVLGGPLFLLVLRRTRGRFDLVSR